MHLPSGRDARGVPIALQSHLTACNRQGILVIAGASLSTAVASPARARDRKRSAIESAACPSVRVSGCEYGIALFLMRIPAAWRTDRAPALVQQRRSAAPARYWRDPVSLAVVCNRCPHPETAGRPGELCMGGRSVCTLLGRRPRDRFSGGSSNRHVHSARDCLQPRGTASPGCMAAPLLALATSSTVGGGGS